MARYCRTLLKTARYCWDPAAHLGEADGRERPWREEERAPGVRQALHLGCALRRRGNAWSRGDRGYRFQIEGLQRSQSPPVGLHKPALALGEAASTSIRSGSLLCHITARFTGLHRSKKTSQHPALTQHVIHVHRWSLYLRHDLHRHRPGTAELAPKLHAKPVHQIATCLPVYI